MKNNWIWVFIKFELEGGSLFLLARGGGWNFICIRKWGGL